MEKQLLRRRMKGLLAVLLAFMMLCGTKMTTLAAELSSLSVGDVITDGKLTYYATTGGLWVVSYYDDNNKLLLTKDHSFSDGGWKKVDLSQDCNSYKSYKVKYTDIDNRSGGVIITTELVGIPDSSPSSPSSPVSPSAPAKEPEKVWEEEPVEEPAAVQTHEHDLSWVECYDATEEMDGLMAYKCSNCGYIDSTAVIPSGLVYVRSFCAAIQNAPENGTIEWDAKGYRCYTKKMMEKLAGRPDVTLTTVYTEKDGTKKSFTIPAGEAPTEDDFYGFVYLGNLYGWN